MGAPVMWRTLAEASRSGIRIRVDGRRVAAGATFVLSTETRKRDGDGYAVHSHGDDGDPGVAALPRLHELRRHGRLDAERGRQPAVPRKAVEAGINFFDTADIYSRGQSEEILGRGLKELGVRRDEVVIATKVFNPMGRGPNRGGLSRKHILQSIDASLTRLGIDYVDLYQIHRFDYRHPDRGNDRGAGRRREGRQGALHRRVARCSPTSSRSTCTWPTSRAGRGSSMMQNHYNLLYREEEREMNPLCLDGRRRPDPLEPAGRRRPGRQPRGRHGALEVGRCGRGRYNRPADHAVIDALEKVAAARGECPAQVAIAWLLSKPAVTAPILGATKAEPPGRPAGRGRQPLSAGEIAALEAPYEAQAVIGAMGAEAATPREIRAPRSPASAA